MIKIFPAKIFFLVITGINAQDIYKNCRGEWLKKGRQYLPELQVKTKVPMQVVLPVYPYLCHNLAEAMIACGIYDEATSLIKDYWGGMAKKGADTFREVYDPGNDFLLPYGSFMMNSYCHAWSCTPVYFLRKYNRELFP
jgi:hypothetical protein